MNETAKVGLAVAGGYLLGRTRKMKTALALGMWIAGRKMRVRPSWMIADAVQQLAKTEEFGKLRSQLSGEVLTAGRKAVGGMVESGAGRLADSLASRTASLTEMAGGAGQAAGKAGKGVKKQLRGRDSDERDEVDEVDEGAEGDEHEAETDEGEAVYPDEERGGERSRSGRRGGSDSGGGSKGSERSSGGRSSGKTSSRDKDSGRDAGRSGGSRQRAGSNRG